MSVLGVLAGLAVAAVAAVKGKEILSDAAQKSKVMDRDGKQRKMSDCFCESLQDNLGVDPDQIEIYRQRYAGSSMEELRRVAQTSDRNKKIAVSQLVKEKRGY